MASYIQNYEFTKHSIQDNNHLRYILGAHPVEIPLEKRLINDFLSDKSNKHITLEGTLIKRKSRRDIKKYNKRRKTSRHR
jgi:hypothetical protein